MSIFNTGRSLLKKTKVVPVFLTITDDYAKYAAAAINSLMKHANHKRYYRVIIIVAYVNYVHALYRLNVRHLLGGFRRFVRCCRFVCRWQFCVMCVYASVNFLTDLEWVRIFCFVCKSTSYSVQLRYNTNMRKVQ